MKKPTYALFVSYPLPSENVADTMKRRDKEIVALVGKPNSGSGAGLGRRDVEFFYDNLIERDAAADKVRDEVKYEVSIANYT